MFDDPTSEPPATPPPYPPSATPPYAEAVGTGPIADETLASPAAPEPKKNGWKQWAIAGGVAAAIGIGGIVAVNAGKKDGAASASVATQATGDSSSGTASGSGTGGQAQGGQPGFPGGRGTSGKITAIDGDTITVEATDRQSGDTSSVTVDTSGDTTYTESVEGSVDDVSVGATVRVMGQAGTDGTVAASTVVIGGDASGFPGGGTPPSGTPPTGDGTMPEGFTPPNGGSLPDGQMPRGGPGGFTSGEVTAVDGSTVTVKNTDGETVKVALADDTTYTVVKKIGLDDLAVGDTIRVTGTTTDATVTATSIRKGDLGGGFGGGFGGGGPGQAPPAGGGDGTSGGTTPTTTA